MASRDRGLVVNRRGFFSLLAGATAAAMLPIAWATRAPQIRVEHEKERPEFSFNAGDLEKHIEDAAKAIGCKVDDDFLNNYIVFGPNYKEFLA
jgi:hypothetical protein